MTPHVTLIGLRGQTPIAEVWSANSDDGATLTVELLQPGLPGAETGRWEALGKALHPSLALPLPVDTARGPAVALSPNIGRPALQATGDPEPLAALGATLAMALQALHAAGLGHNAISPSLICVTPDGQTQLVVTAACALPLDVAGDIGALRGALSALDGEAFLRLTADHDLRAAQTARDLGEIFTTAAVSRRGELRPPDLRPAAPPALPPLESPGVAPRLVPAPPPRPGGNPPPAARPARTSARSALPTRPLFIAGGVGVALVAIAAIAGAATTSSAPSVKPSTTATTSARATMTPSSAPPVTPPAVSPSVASAAVPQTSAAVTTTTPPAAPSPPASPTHQPNRPKATPTKTTSASPRPATPSAAPVKTVPYRPPVRRPTPTTPAAVSTGTVAPPEAPTPINSTTVAPPH